MKSSVHYVHENLFNTQSSKLVLLSLGDIVLLILCILFYFAKSLTCK